MLKNSLSRSVFLGRLPGIKNGFVNVGPGFNGWKIAAGTGEFLARVMDLGPDKARRSVSHKIFLIHPP